MLARIVSNKYIEKLELLPDDIYVDVSKSWCHSVIRYLNINEQHEDLLNMVSSIVFEQEQNGISSFSVPRFVKMSVGDIKKVVNICKFETFWCKFPYNYDQLVNMFLDDKLGAMKIQIELLIADNKIDEVFEIIWKIEDSYIRKLSLLYAKSIYDSETERILEDIKISRKRTINDIISKFC